MADIISIAHRHGEDEKILSDDVVVCLRKWLKMAEDGDLISVAIVGENKDRSLSFGKTAACRTFKIIGALDVIKLELINDMNDGMSELETGA